MSKHLDQLLKLIKLANNNPNEHEANAAARKVCKMLMEKNYRITEAPQPSTPVSDPLSDILRWARQQNPQNVYYKSPFTSGSWSNPFRDEQEDDNEWFSPENKTHHKRHANGTIESLSETEAKARGWKGYGSPFNQKNYYRQDWQVPPSYKRKEKEEIHKKWRKCTQCLTDVETFNTKDPYICHKCDWDNYYNAAYRTSTGPEQDNS